MTDIEHESTETEKDHDWNRQLEQLNTIRKIGFARYVEAAPETKVHDAFIPKDRTVRCMDEGCVGGVHVAGAGILFDKEDYAEFLRNCQKLGVDGFTSHEGCGAATLAAGGDASRGKKMSADFSGAMAAELGVGNREIVAAEMHRPRTFHNARVVYYDGTGTFDYSRAPEVFPPGFTLTRALYPKDRYAIADAELAVKIATGDHGFGERITSVEPVMIIAIGSTTGETARLMNELAPLATKNSRVIIDGFTSALEALAEHKAAA